MQVCILRSFVLQGIYCHYVKKCLFREKSAVIDTKSESWLAKIALAAKGSNFLKCLIFGGWNINKGSVNNHFEFSYIAGKMASFYSKTAVLRQNEVAKWSIIDFVLQKQLKFNMNMRSYYEKVIILLYLGYKWKDS